MIGALGLIVLVWLHGYLTGLIYAGGETWASWCRKEAQAWKSEPDENLSQWAARLRRMVRGNDGHK